MNETHFREIRTGSDPRALPDFMTLRDELSKLSHPARPDVNWCVVEDLCLRLFEHNGVELQTLAWYTQARTRTVGLAGLNEGLALLEALITFHWGTLWPQPVHARVDILSGLSQRLQQIIRMHSFVYQDLSALYQAEQHLAQSCAQLQRLELRHLSQLENLRIQLHNAAVRLENNPAPGEGGGPHGLVVPGEMPPARGGMALSGTDRQWIFVAQPDAGTMPDRPLQSGVRKAFFAGMMVMLALVSVAAGGWHVLARPDPLLARLQASLAPLPEALSAQQLSTLKQQHTLPAELIPQTREHLNRLLRLPPDYAFRQGQARVQQLQMLWPDNPEVLSLTREWQQHPDAAALPAESLTGWHKGMTQLQQLASRLNGLDENKGKYMTVSELKSQIYAITQAFSQTVPAEERLRQLADRPASTPIPAALHTQTALHLRQLLARYALMTPAQESHYVTP